MSRGKFITFEGGEGVGKTTQIELLVAFLQRQGLAVTQTREPGGTEIGEAIRAVLLDKKLPAMHSDTELLLMFAARAEHVQSVIEPALSAGDWVVSDRFADASHVYQGAGRGVDLTRLERLHDWTLGDFEPDLTLLLDMPVDRGMARVHQRGETDRFEEENLIFFQRIRDAYLSRAEQYASRFEVIDASLDIETVASQITNRIQSWLPS